MRPLTETSPERGLLAAAGPLRRGRALFPAAPGNEDGQTFGEYGLILALVVLVGVAGLSPFGAGLAAVMTATFNTVVAAL